MSALRARSPAGCPERAPSAVPGSSPRGIDRWQRMGGSCPLRVGAARVTVRRCADPGPLTNYLNNRQLDRLSPVSARRPVSAREQPTIIILHHLIQCNRAQRGRRRFFHVPPGSRPWGRRPCFCVGQSFYSAGPEAVVGTCVRACVVVCATWLGARRARRGTTRSVCAVISLSALSNIRIA